jgi:acetyl esterase/lipase
MRATRSKIITLAVLAVVCLWAWPRVRIAYLATLVLAESVTPETDGPMARIRSAPVVEETSFAAGEKTILADVYRPPTPGRHPGIVLNHGVAETGRRDPRLVNFADALARAGYVALVPEFTNLAEFKVRPSDVDEIIASFEHLERMPDVKPDRVGLFGFSYAGGLIVLAASDPRIADRVRFCFILGGYYDLVDVVAYMTTGKFRSDGQWVTIEPRNSGRWAFLLNSVDLIEGERDRALLAEIARAKWEDPESDVSGLVTSLGDEGSLVYALMVNEDPEKTGTLVDGLNPRIRGYFDALSLPGKMDRLKAHLIVAHGRDDNMIPYTESVLLAQNVPRGVSVHLALLESFQHMDMKLGTGRGLRGFVASLSEIRRLFSIVYDLLAQGLL